jgi:hypothetical protein
MSLSFNPNLYQARRRSELAHRVLVKLKTLGLSDDQDDALATLCTDIGDLWSSQLVFLEILNRFLEKSDNWDSIGDDLVDMLSNVEHISWHIDSLKKPLETLAQYSYSESKNTQ